MRAASGTVPDIVAKDWRTMRSLIFLALAAAATSVHAQQSVQPDCGSIRTIIYFDGPDRRNVIGTLEVRAEGNRILYGRTSAYWAIERKDCLDDVMRPGQPSKD